MDTSCTQQTSIPFIGLGLPELLLYDFCNLVTFLSVVWNRGWDNCVDFVLEILTDKSVLLLLGGDVITLPLHADRRPKTEQAARLQCLSDQLHSDSKSCLHQPAGSRDHSTWVEGPMLTFPTLNRPVHDHESAYVHLAQDKQSDSSMHTPRTECNAWSTQTYCYVPDSEKFLRTGLKLVAACP